MERKLPQAPMPRYALEHEIPVYAPDEDTFLLLDAIYGVRLAFSPSGLLEVGCGYGCAGTLLGTLYGYPVTFSDVNPRALACAKHTAELNGVESVYIESDLLAAFLPREQRFDLIVFNPPYVPGVLRPTDPLDGALCGGVRGREVIDRFLSELALYWANTTRKCLYLVCIRENDVEELTVRLKYLFSAVRVVAERNLPSERLCVLFCESE